MIILNQKDDYVMFYASTCGMDKHAQDKINHIHLLKILGRNHMICYALI